MPMNYNFQFAGTSGMSDADLQSRQTVDDEIRVACGLPPDTERWSSLFEALVYCVGMTATRQTGKSHFTEDEVRAAVEAEAVDREETAKRFDDSDPARAAEYREYATNYRESVDLFVEFMCKRYTFNIWRS